MKIHKIYSRILYLTTFYCIVLICFCQITIAQVIQSDKFIPEINQLLNDMVFIKGGTYNMGCTDEQGYDCDENEYPVHPVLLDDYYIGKFEVTVSQYRIFCSKTNRIMRNPPEWGWHDNHPIIFVNWFDASSFCKWLSNETGYTFRLPTEAEWEYAARGGNKSELFKYCGGNDIGEYAWYIDNDKGQSHPVGMKKPNELGLYDMCGNVWEWCFDWLDDHYYKFSPKENPRGPSTRFARVLRGGSFGVKQELCRVALRSGSEPSYRTRFNGFRVVMENYDENYLK